MIETRKEYDPVTNSNTYTQYEVRRMDPPAFTPIGWTPTNDKP